MTSSPPQSDLSLPRRRSRGGSRVHRVAGAAIALAILPTSAHASIFQGEALDKFADILSWVVFVVVPIAGIVAFWLVHIMPEKIAEKRRHPQAEAIQVLCILSLFFGGLLWPLAWLWAYSKPVLYKMAYGTDVAPEHEHVQVTKVTAVEKKEKA